MWMVEVVSKTTAYYELAVRHASPTSSELCNSKREIPSLLTGRLSMTFKGVAHKVVGYVTQVFEVPGFRLCTAGTEPTTVGMQAAKVPEFSCSPHAQRFFIIWIDTYEVVLSGVMIVLGGNCALCADGHLYI